MPYLERQGARVFHERQGEGHPPLLFVHGFACSHDDWQPQVDSDRDWREVQARLRLALAVTEGRLFSGKLAVIEWVYCSSAGLPAWREGRTGFGSETTTWMEVTRL